LKFCSSVKVIDPFLLHISPLDANAFMASYAYTLAAGESILSICIKSKTIEEYLRGAAKYIQKGRTSRIAQQLLQYPDPRVDVTTGTTSHRILGLIKEVKRWESRPNRRDPLDKRMLTHLSQIKESSLYFSRSMVLFDWLILGLHLGFRRSEYAQKAQSATRTRIQCNKDGTPTAFVVSDIEFYDAGRCPLSHDQAVKMPASVVSVDLRWREQKNGQKHEKKTVVRSRSPVHCAAAACVHIVRRAQELSIPDDHPICVYTDTGIASGEIRFITEIDISECLQLLAGQVYKLTKPEELARFTSHSVRVGACVALHAAGLSKEDIKHALRWRSNTFWDYLRNLPGQALRCADAIANFDPRILNLDF
jgi:hypothetical protein